MMFANSFSFSLQLKVALRPSKLSLSRFFTISPLCPFKSSFGQADKVCLPKPIDCFGNFEF